MDAYANDGTQFGSPGAPQDITPPPPPPIGNPQAFIVHHTGGGGDVDGVRQTLRERGLGVQYVMDRDGNIYQTGGPGSSHMLNGWGPMGKGLSNRNTVGMEVIARDDKDVTPAQVESAQRFINRTYPGIPVYGHGEVNPGHKEADEGMTIVSSIRAQRQPQQQGAQALGYASTDQANNTGPATTVEDWKQNPTRGYQRPVSNDPNAPSGKASDTQATEKGNITVRSTSVGQSARPDDPNAPQGAEDPEAKYLSKTPPPKQPVTPEEDPEAKYLSKTPPAPPPPQREIGTPEAIGKGGLNAVTFGAAPALAGLAEASGIPSAATKPDEIDINPVRPIVGAAKLLHGWYTGHPDEAVRQAYERGRSAYKADEEAAAEQHFGPYMAGQLTGALLTPVPGAGAIGDMSAMAKLGHAFVGNTVGGIFNGVGDALGGGESDPMELAKAGEKGGLVGGAFGVAAHGVGNVLGKAYDYGKGMYNGWRNVEGEAGRRILQTMPEKPAMTNEEVAAANKAGTPRAIIDTGSERTRTLARAVANNSPEGKAALEQTLIPRSQQQGDRVGSFIRNMTGGKHADELEANLKEAARQYNKPRYQRLFSRYPVVNVPESITSRPVVAQAMKDAISLAKNKGEKLEAPATTKTILSGPGYHIADDIPNKAKPSLEYWDYVKKALDDRIEGMKRKGGIDTLDSQEKADWSGLIDAKKALVDHLDNVAPEYKAVREGAAGFFGADNALDAGRNFVMRDASEYEAAQAMKKFSPAERQLFERGFASELADKVESTAFNRDVLNNMFINSAPARRKIYTALGRDKAMQLEALLRVESIIEKSKRAVMNNSSTIAQRAGEGLLGGGLVGGAELLKEHDVDWKTVLGGAVGAAGFRHGAAKIDQRVITRIGEMLASNDPAVLQEGVKLIKASPVLFSNLRAATGAAARVTAADVGADNAAAGLAAGAERLYEGPPHEEGEPAKHDITDQLP